MEKQEQQQKMISFFGDKIRVDKFNTTPKIEDKLDMVWSLPMMQQLLKRSNARVHQKSEGESRRYRDLGNKHYQGGRWKDAARCFSTAMAFAVQDENHCGRDLSLAMANRSAALLQLSEPRLSLLDIELSLEAGYPQDLRYKVIERKVRCLALLGEKENASNIIPQLKQALEVSTLEAGKKDKIVADVEEFMAGTDCETTKDEIPPWLILPKLKSHNKALPAFSDALELQYESSRGRFAISNRKILSGEIVGIEKPVTSSLYPDLSEDHCDFCMKFTPLWQLPCDYCTQERFCSKKCRTEAMDTYHQYECGREDVFDSTLGKILSNGKKSADSGKKFHRLALKTITQKSLAWFLKNRSLVRKNPGCRDGEGNGYGGLATLVSHNNKMNQDRIFFFLMSAIFHLRTLQQTGYFGASRTKVGETLNENEKYIGGLLYTYLEVMQFNTHAIVDGTADIDKDFLNGQLRPDKLYENKIRCIGHGVYASLALLNHSCHNNTNKYFVGTTVVVIASRNILPGEEITENYYPVAQVMDRPDRRAWLSEHYWFDCCCHACSSNLESVRNMSAIPTVFRCTNKTCNGIIKASQCPTCKVTIDRKDLTEEVEKVRKRMEETRLDLHSRTSRERLLTLYDETVSGFRRLQDLVEMPCRLLYTGEIQLWRALRLVHGNRSY